MTWANVGEWLKNNTGSGVALVGSLLTGNIPGAIAAGVSLVSTATGTSDPLKALNQLQSDPATVVRLKELASQEEQNIREHIRAMTELEYKDRQAEQAEQQLTIRTGDTAGDEYVRHTRPMMARQSWYATMSYVLGFELLKAFKITIIGADMNLAMIVIAPAAAYLGFRTFDKKWGAK